MGAEQAIGGLAGGLSGAAAGAMLAGTKAGAFLGPAGMIGGAVIGGLAGILGSKKPKAPKYQPLDISKVIEDARTQAATQLKDSIALEAQYRPGTSFLRGVADDQLSKIGAGRTAGQLARNELLTSIMGDGGSNPLLEESASRILGELRLGGELDAETQAAVTRGALEGAGTAGISGGAMRGLVARDLGLTSLGLRNQRQQAALNAGNVLQSNRLNTLGAVSNIAQQDISTGGLLASIIDARALPEAGLSAGSVADLYIADNNARNGLAAQNASIAASRSNSNLQAMLGLATTAATLAGAMGSRTPTVNQVVPQVGGVGTTPIVQGSDYLRLGNVASTSGVWPPRN